MGMGALGLLGNTWNSINLYYVPDVFYNLLFLFRSQKAQMGWYTSCINIKTNMHNCILNWWKATTEMRWKNENVKGFTKLPTNQTCQHHWGGWQPGRTFSPGDVTWNSTRTPGRLTLTFLQGTYSLFHSQHWISYRSSCWAKIFIT